MDVDKNWAFIAGNGDIRKLPKFDVKSNIKSDDGNDVEENIDNEDTEDKENNEITFDEGIMTRAKKRMKASENDSLNEDAIAKNWMTAEQHYNFESFAVYTVDIPAKEQNIPEVDDA